MKLHGVGRAFGSESIVLMLTLSAAGDDNGARHLLSLEPIKDIKKGL